MDIANIWKYELRKGNTDHPRNGACLFDAGMWLVYGKIGDDPPCSCPVIRSYAIGLNDRMPDQIRSKLLKPFILRVVGNRDPGAEPERLRVIVLETARRVVPMASKPPAFQDLRKLPDDAPYGQIRSATAAAASATAASYAAASAASYAASAAAASTTAASTTAVWEEAAKILDEALRIGKQSPEFDEWEVRARVKAFAEAAGDLENV